MADNQSKSPRCPRCDSENVEDDGLTIEGSIAKVDMICFMCGFCYSDRYVLANEPQKVIVDMHDGEPFVTSCPDGIIVEIRVVQNGEPEDPPAYLTCHNPKCRRYGKTAYGLHYSEDLDSWVCSECGGTDVY